MSEKKRNIGTKETEYIGLWYQKEWHRFCSPTIDLSELNQFEGAVKIVVIKNRFYKQGTNRPNYCLKITSSKNAVFKDKDNIVRLAQDYVTIPKYELLDALQSVKDGAVRWGREGYSEGDVRIDDFTNIEEEYSLYD